MSELTFKDMCETIARADFLRKKDGTAPTPEEIWNYSPTGELLMIHEWYQEALSILRAKAERQTDTILAPEVQRMIREAVEREREACAKAAENYGHGKGGQIFKELGKCIGETIRLRTLLERQSGLDPGAPGAERG